MKVQQHPDYPQEIKKLKDTYQYILTFINKHKEPISSQAADSKTAIEISRLKLKQLEELKQAQAEPYFGRVDVKFKDHEQPGSLYIGKYSISDKDVYSWQDTAVADFYYIQTSKKNDGRLILKRTFTLNYDQLKRIIDEFVDPEFARQAKIEGAEFTDHLLMQLLTQYKHGKLHDIITTIQQQQYRIISSPLEQVLVVQGVPGSGKTQVALHRVSYLLYHHRNDGRVTPNRVLILGPNPIFMRYIGHVLPDLGNRRLLQRTFDEWLIEQLGDTLNYESQDDSLETLLDHDRPTAERVMRYRNAQNKGSLKMAQVLTRYVNHLYQQIYEQVIIAQGDFVCQFNIRGTRWGPVPVMVEELKQFLDDAGTLPLNQRQGEVRRQLIRHILRKMLNSRLSSPGQQTEREVAEKIESELQRYLINWRRENVSIAYRRLLRNPETLRLVGAGIFSEWDMELLAQDAPTAQIPFRFSDLAALLYFKILLDGPSQPLYDHIVIDEAQDLTPLHFKVLHEYSRKSSMTVLGDLAQSIYPHHGLAEWDDLSEAVGTIQPIQENIRESYRSTREITEAANRLLKHVGLEEHQAIPFARKGEQVKTQKVSTQSQLVTNLVNVIKAEQAKDRQAIALIAKTSRDCVELADLLKDEGFHDFELLHNRQLQYNGGVVVIPVYLTKGLEFDTAIITNANTKAYPPDKLHARLLYVAMTRAAHMLYVFWVDELTLLLDKNKHALKLSPFLDGEIAPKPVTIDTFAPQVAEYSIDWLVERLAGADKLLLLQNGCIDQCVLENLVRQFKRRTGTRSQETIAQALSPELRQQIEFIISNLMADPDPKISKALTLIQLIQNLLNSQLRSVGLLLPEHNANLLADQTILLATLLKAILTQDMALNAGRWTTRKVVLSGLSDPTAQVTARNQLDILIRYGIVETKDNPSGIRVPQDRIQGILELSLGYDPWDWDQDILFDLDRIPEPIPMEAKPEVINE